MFQNLPPDNLEEVQKGIDEYLRDCEQERIDCLKAFETLKDQMKQQSESIQLLLDGEADSFKINFYERNYSKQSFETLMMKKPRYEKSFGATLALSGKIKCDGL